MGILQGERLFKRFGGLVATDRVDFQIEEGEIIGLIGPNGSGKSTLFNLISGAIPLTEGVIKFKGENITGLKPYQICKKGIGRTFQLVNIFGHMTVLENVLLASQFGIARAPRTFDAVNNALESLEFVGLDGMQGSLALELTIGNQKRLEVARALATGPDLLLLDEFMAGLNPTEVTQAVDLIGRIRKREITIFMIEHVMKAIMGVSDRIIVLHYGKKISEGTPKEIAADKMVKEVYLGT